MLLIHIGLHIGNTYKYADIEMVNTDHVQQIHLLFLLMHPLIAQAQFNS